MRRTSCVVLFLLAFVVPAGAQTASITVVKTVMAGSDTSVCAATDSIILPPGGGEVAYCYTVTNTGDVSFDRHDLVDDQSGTLLNDFPFPLAPGASAFLVDVQTVTATVTNTGTWTAFDSQGPQTATASDTATVTVEEAEPSISLAKTVAAGSDVGVCAATDSIILPPGGGEVAYCYQVTNTGNVPFDTHNLVDDQTGQHLTDFPFLLVPGASAFLVDVETVTATVTNTGTWTASHSTGPQTAMASDTATVTVEASEPSITLVKTVMAGSDTGICATTDSIILPPGGGEVAYCYQVTNTGNVPFDTHNLVDDQSGQHLTDFPFLLVPGASAFLVDVETVTATVTNTATWTASHSTGPQTAMASDTATVTVTPAVTAAVPTASEYGLLALALLLGTAAWWRMSA